MSGDSAIADSSVSGTMWLIQLRTAGATTAACRSPADVAGSAALWISLVMPTCERGACRNAIAGASSPPVATAPRGAHSHPGALAHGELALASRDRFSKTTHRTRSSPLPLGRAPL